MLIHLSIDNHIFQGTIIRFEKDRYINYYDHRLVVRWYKPGKYIITDKQPIVSIDDLNKFTVEPIHTLPKNANS